MQLEVQEREEKGEDGEGQIEVEEEKRLKEVRSWGDVYDKTQILSQGGVRRHHQV